MKLIKLLNKKTKMLIVSALIAMTAAGGGLHRVNDLGSTREEPNAVVERVLQEEISKENEERLRVLVDFLNNSNGDEIERARDMLVRNMRVLINMSRQNPHGVRISVDRLYEVFRASIADVSHSNFQDVNSQVTNALREELINLNIQDEKLEISSKIQFIIFVVLVLITIISLLTAIHFEEKYLRKGEEKFSSKS